MRFTFTAGPAEGQRGVNLILDFDQSIEYHRAAPGSQQVQPNNHQLQNLVIIKKKNST